MERDIVVAVQNGQGLAGGQFWKSLTELKLSRRWSPQT